MPFSATYNSRQSKENFFLKIMFEQKQQQQPTIDTDKKLRTHRLVAFSFANKLAV